MLKQIMTALVLAGALSTAHAATLTSDPYPVNGLQPTAASFTVNGGTPIPCVMTPVTGGVAPVCPLTSINAAGTYTLVLSVTRAASITNGTNAGTVVEGDTASSVPFAFTYSVGNIVVKPPKLN